MRLGAQEESPMRNEVRAVLLAVVTVVCGVSLAPGGNEPPTGGKLIVASPSPSPSPAVWVGDEDVSGAKGPHCSPKFIGAVDVAALNALGIGPETLGVEMIVLDAPMMLHKLQVQLYGGGQVVWQSDPMCIGCQQFYPVSDDKSPPTYFRLDATGVALALQQYPQVTAVGLAGRGHDGATARFSFVKLEPAQPLK
jgi:hypothetical protein